MKALIKNIIGLWRGADHATAEMDGQGQHGFHPDQSAVEALVESRVKYQTGLVLDDKARILLPTNEIAHVLPDRSGVFIVFNSIASVGQGFVALAPPCNAAIFNADGSLRFQLKNPIGEYGIFRSVVSLSMPDSARGLGVRSCPKDWPVCEWVYFVDGSTDDLSKQIARFVRD